MIVNSKVVSLHQRPTASDCSSSTVESESRINWSNTRTSNRFDFNLPKSNSEPRTAPPKKTGYFLPAPCNELSGCYISVPSNDYPKRAVASSMGKMNDPFCEEHLSGITERDFGDLQPKSEEINSCFTDINGSVEHHLRSTKLTESERFSHRYSRLIDIDNSLLALENNADRFSEKLHVMTQRCTHQAKLISDNLQAIDSGRQALVTHLPRVKESARQFCYAVTKMALMTTASLGTLYLAGLLAKKHSTIRPATIDGTITLLSLYSVAEKLKSVRHSKELNSLKEELHSVLTGLLEVGQSGYEMAMNVMKTSTYILSDGGTLLEEAAQTASVAAKAVRQIRGEY